jgi:hypothetical protein
VLVAPPGAPVPPKELDGWAPPAQTVRPATGTGTAMLVRPDGYVAWASDESE